MLSNHASQKNSENRGYSLLEMILTVIIVGILAAIAIPSFIGLLNQNRVKEGSARVKGAIREAQRQAIRRGRRCKIRIDTTNRKITVSSPDAHGNYSGCLLSERTLPKGVAIKTNYSTPVITFSPRGNTNSAGTIVVYNIDGAQAKKCIAISLGLGIIRSGDYTGDVSTSISATQCKTTD
ncbi:GspH/FimT family pseudopilin [Pleurocapsales cyanobacterium LEGE 06147]|nr:GspH/FimT family pseudopilin [Pleurocapsales cyanobacterium LEGE 06147]